MLSGHTHGGQICLPGSIPITLSSAEVSAEGSPEGLAGQLEEKR